MGYRKFLGALTLGLPAAVSAHFVTFGNSHTVGGAAHGLVMDGMLGALCASVVALLLGAAYFAAAHRSGSLVAARLGRFLPATPLIALAAAGWFCLIERAEVSHSTPVLLAGTVLVLVAALLRVAVSASLRLLAAVALAFFTLPFAAREPERFASFVWVAPTQQRRHLAISRYSRPPPSFT